VLDELDPLSATIAVLCLSLEADLGVRYAGVVDEDVRAAELLPDAVGPGNDRGAVGNVRLDRDRAVAELVGQSLVAAGVAGKQRDAVAVRGQCLAVLMP
jgi:hypothetical protein